MLLREKGKKDGDPVSMGWDEAQAALLAGTHESAEGYVAEGDEVEKAAVEQPQSAATTVDTGSRQASHNSKAAKAS